MGLLVLFSIGTATGGLPQPPMHLGWSAPGDRHDIPPSSVSFWPKGHAAQPLFFNCDRTCRSESIRSISHPAANTTAMPRPTSAFPLIKDRLPEYCKKLTSIPPFAFWIHEVVLADYLGLRQGPSHGKSEALTALLECLRKGYGGDQKKGT